MLVGLTEKEGKQRLEEIRKAIKDGTILTNEKLRVSAMRYSMYGDKRTTAAIDEKTGLYKIMNFVDSDAAEVFNIDKIEKGINLFVNAGKYYEKNSIDGIRMDHYYMGNAMQDLMTKVKNNTASLAGQNHLGHDIPIMQNQLLQWHNMYKGKTNMFNIDMDMDAHKTIDLLGGSRAFIEYKGVSALYPGSNMAGAKKVAGQEYMAQIHLEKWFNDNNIQAHKAEDDVLALLGLFTQKSDILNDNMSVLDHIYKGLEGVKTTDTTLNASTHILRAKKRAGALGGKGYINFAMDSQDIVYTASDHIIGGNDGISKAVGGAFHENFNVGFGVNKGAFYEINQIQKISMTDEIRTKLGNLAPEYSGKNLYHVQLSMAVTDNFKDTRLGDLKQNFFFKNEKELQGFLSSNFDVVADKTEEGIKIRKEHLDKFDIRELQGVKGRPVFADVDKNWAKDHNKLYNDALDFSANKILTSRAENSLLRDAPYAKITKALDLEQNLLNYFKEIGIEKSNLSQREINQIMSSRVATGQMALGLNEKQIEHSRGIIESALSYTKRINGEEIGRTLNSSVDNYSSIMSFISGNKTVLNNIRKEIEAKAKDRSNAYKQELFARTYEAVKRETAEYIYRNSDNTDAAIARAVLTDKKLKTSVHEFKNTYEIDLSSLMKDSNVGYYSLEHPSHLNNIHKLDISSKSPMYSLIDKSTQAMYGKEYKGITDFHKQAAVEELFATLNKEDKLLSKTKAFRNLKDTFGFEKGKFQKEVNYLNIADTIIGAMQEVKAKDKFAGIKNTKHAFMKSLEGNESFIAALNSADVQKTVGGVVDNIMSNLNLNIISSSSNNMEGLNSEIDTIVENVLMKHYVPDYDKVSSIIGNDSRKEMLYLKGRKDIKTYLTDTIKGFTSISGTDISIQDDGALLITNGAKDPVILKNLPRMKLDGDSGVLYLQVGNQKLQLNKKLMIDSQRNNIVGDVGTNISHINKYSNIKGLKDVVEAKGEAEGIDKLVARINSDMKSIMQGATINNFGGNDIDSNYNVDLSEIKNVLNDLFGESGRFKHYVDDLEFADKKLHETLKAKLARSSFDDKGRLKNMSPDMTRDIVKDVFHILETISTHGQVTTDFKDVLGNTLGFTGQEKKVSSLIAYEGKDRPNNSTFGVFDNTQRPPITQSGNAKFLRIDDITKAKAGEANVLAGNIISSAATDKKTMRTFAGVGNATTDVMLDTYYVSTNALKVLVESNFNDVINKAKVEFGTLEAAKNAYAYIRDSMSTFEQERIMDSRTHEAIYGLQTAATHKLSKGVDIKSILKDLDGEDLIKQRELIANHRGNFKIDGDRLIYSSSIGTHVTRGEGTIKSKGFANLVSSFSSKVKHGVFNFNYYNSNGMKLKDKEINAIINENIDMFKQDGGFVDKNKFSAILDKVLEEKGIFGQYAIEDISALGYAKTMTSGAEKGMTDILYATTGKYDKNVRKVFENIGMWDDVKSKVLTDEAVDALVLRSEHNPILKSIFKGTNFKTVDDLKSAMKKERHMHSELLFNYGLGNKTHLIANDNVVGHANFGAMYQGSLSKALDLVSKKHKDGMEGAVQAVVDMINSKEEFQFMENWNLAKGKIDISAIGVSNVKGRLVINQEFFTENDRVSNLNSTKFNNLIKALDAKYLDDGKDSDDRLVRNNVYMLNVNEDGTETYKKVDEIIGAFYSRQINGKTVLLGAQTKENTKYVTDVETQTGVTDEYFQLKKVSTQLQRNKIELEKQINSTNDSKIKSTLNTDLLKVKGQISDIQEELSSYEGTVKIMKFSDQELSIVNRVAVTQSHISQINELIDKGEINSEIINSLSLKDRLRVGVGGEVIGTSDLKLGNILKDGRPERDQGYRALGWFTDSIRKNQWYNDVTDVKLDKAMLDLDEYKHLKEVYDYFENKGMDIGANKAQEVWQTRMALSAKDFNAGDKGHRAIKALEDKGFEKVHIDNLALDAQEISTRNLLIDLGEDFSTNPLERYVALPGTGKLVVDEEIRKESHKSFTALKHRYDEYMSIRGRDPEESTRLFNSIKSLTKDIEDNIDKELFNKNGIMHNLSKVELTVPSYRNKLSGFIGSHFDDKLLKTADNFNVGFINSLNSSLTNIATIDGKSIAELEKAGQYYDYKFISREQFENMGYFKEDKLKQFGFVDDKDGSAISKMEEHLRKHGTMDIFDRYPNTRTGSLAPTHVFLGDDSLANNQSKVSVSLAMKANADFDGDSGSSFLLSFTDSKGREIDGAYYHRVKTMAMEQLKEQGLEINANSLADAAELTGMIAKEDFEKFHKLQAQMTIASGTENLKWAQKGKQIITKDNIKNLKLGDITNASMVEGAYSDLFSVNAVAKISQMPTLDDYYNTERSANEIIAKAQELNNAHNISAQFIGSDGKGAKAWEAFSNVTDIRSTDSPDAMDKSIAILEKSFNKGLIDEDYLNMAKSTAIKKVGHDRYTQEMMAKTGLAATGNVNVVLNSIKLATQFTETDPSKINFTNFIWEGLDVAEQGVISSKKVQGGGLDDDKITSFTEAMNNIYKNNKRDIGRQQLEKWMDANGGSVFETAYDEMGKYILGPQEYRATTREEGIKNIKNKFLDFVAESSQDGKFMTVRASLEAVGRNSNHDNNIADAAAAAAFDEPTSLRASSLGAAGLGNETRAKAVLKESVDKAKAASRKAINEIDYQERISQPATEMVEQAATGTVQTALKHMPKINMSGGSGLGMAVLGTAAGLLVSGYASGNPLRDKQASEVAQSQTQQQTTMSVPQFMEQGGMVTGNSQGGYVINLQADTKKGRKYMKQMMAQAAQASVGGAVSVNMNLRDVSKNGITDKDIEDFMNRHL